MTPIEIALIVTPSMQNASGTGLSQRDQAPSKRLRLGGAELPDARHHAFLRVRPDDGYVLLRVASLGRSEAAQGGIPRGGRALGRGTSVVVVAVVVVLWSMALALALALEGLVRCDVAEGPVFERVHA